MTRRTFNLLIVEDNPADARFLQLLLQEASWAHYGTTTTTSLGEALSVLASDAPVDAVLLDLNLPDSSGLETFDRIHAACDRPVLVLTGVGGEELALQAVARGAQDFLVKGEVDSALLSRAIAYAVERHRAEAARRAAEQQVVERERYYGAILQSMQESLLMIDRDHRVTDANPAALQMVGCRPGEIGEIKGQLCHEVLFHSAVPCSNEERSCPLPDVFTTGETKRYVMQRVDEGGRRRTVEALLSPMYGRAGEVTRVIGSVRDITERAELEEQLRQAQKMDAMGHLAGGVAHDFNNLLMVILGGSELLLERAAEDDPIRKQLTQILGAGERAAGLTRQLLAFSRRQAREPAVVDLGQVVGNLAKMLGRILGEDVRLEVQAEDELWRVLADVGHLEQVLLNLSVNARDAMPTGGNLRVTVGNETVPDENRWPDEMPPPGCYVCLQVADEGVGMEPQVLKRVFEPFFTTKAAGKGTGLGLSTVYGIVKENKGFVYASSTPDRGSVFRVYFPRHGEAAEEAPEGEPPSSALRGSERVLVVEDDPNVCRLMVKTLRNHGYRVSAADLGAKAVAAGEAEPFDAVVADVVLPDVRGTEVVRRLRERSPGLRALYVSGYPDRGDVLWGPTDAFLPKPFSPQRLARVLRGLLDEPAGQAGEPGEACL